MYTISVESGFSATHRVRMPDGALEPKHGHDWRVRVFFSGPSLDRNDMVVDFCQARETLDSILASLNHSDLNALEAFADRNPTAEVVARYVFDRVLAMGLPMVRRVEVTEAPSCVAGFDGRGLESAE